MKEEDLIEIVKAINMIFKESNSTIMEQLTIISAVKLSLDTSIFQQIINDKSNHAGDYIR
jgi:hypothetical protein|tara:strand:+ start:177 stop:356 length:180 start_codon:yes stop_codon:yes gene_type:complete